MTRMTLLAATSALALIGAPALAQTSSSGGSLGSAPSAMHQQPKPDPLKQDDVSQIKGSTVYGSDNKKIGSVDKVLMKPGSKQIDRLVVGAGGVLGLGAHDVALPVDQFRWDSQKGGFTIAKTEADLKAMPAWSGSGSEKTMSGSSTAPAPKAPATSH